jgi:hypothetical protein
LVGQKILEIVESGTWQLRHPVGPNALPLLKWRGQMADEEWVDLNAGDDESFFRRMTRDLNPDTQPTD